MLAEVAVEVGPLELIAVLREQAEAEAEDIPGKLLCLRYHPIPVLLGLPEPLVPPPEEPEEQVDQQLFQWPPLFLPSAERVELG